MFFTPNKQVDPLAISTPVLAVNAEIGVLPGTGDAAINSVSNQADTGGGDATSWVGSLRRGCDVWGYEEPVWSTGYTRTASNPHKQALFTYLGSKNVKVARIGFSWEAIQPSALGSLDVTYLAAIKLDVDRCLAQGIYVNICPWQYNPAVSDTDITYYGAAITSANFADFWGKVAAAFSYDSRISFGLINEPHTNAEGFGAGKIGISLNNWFIAAQAAVNAIRTAGSTNYITVPGMGYASAGNWVANGSAAKFIAMTDTLSPKRLICEVHNYGDDYATTAGNNLGPNMQPAVDHARTNGYKIFIGELAASNNPAENPVSSTTIAKWTTFVNFVNTNQDVFCAWCWFACDDNTVAGWGEDFFHWSLTASGTNNVDSRWMNLIENDLGSTPTVSGADLIADTIGAHPIWKTGDFKGASLHSLNFTQASSQRFRLSSPKILSAGASHFATVKYTASDATPAQSANAPMTLFGSSTDQIFSAGFSAGKARYVYGSAAAGSTVPASPIAFTKNNSFGITASGVTSYVYVPTAYDATHNTPIPLYIFLHGCGGNAEGDAWNVSIGGSQTYMTLSIGGRDGGCWSSPAIDGPKIMNALNDLKTKFNIDPGRVMLGGYSSGGDIGYPFAFANSDLFAGVAFENTSPRSYSGMSLAASASNKFHIAHLAHTSDNTDGGNYSPTTVQSDLATLSGLGYDTHFVEKAGGHYNADGALGANTGTTYDLRTFLMPFVNSSGWVGPGALSGGWTNYDSAITTLNDGGTHTVCWTHSTGGVLKVYVDGALNNTWSGISYNISTAIDTLGSGYLNADTFGGSVGEAYSWNGVLTDQQIRDLHSRSSQNW